MIAVTLISFDLAFRQILSEFCPYLEVEGFLLGFNRVVLFESKLRTLGSLGFTF